MSKIKLLSVGTNAKTVKGDKASEYLTAIMYLSPHRQNERGTNLCPKASDGCVNACLYTAGRGKFTNVQNARKRKADWFVSDRESFLEQLHRELLDFSRYARLRGKKPAVRLNGTSDILWENLVDMTLYPEIQFYDYTKHLPIQRRKIADNYHLTFSRSETDSDDRIKNILEGERNVAVVFNSDTLPKTYLGREVVDGDKTDLRFLDKKGGVVVGLTAKGEAKKDDSGFVIHLE